MTRFSFEVIPDISPGRNESHKNSRHGHRCRLLPGIGSFINMHHAPTSEGICDSASFIHSRLLDVRIGGKTGQEAYPKGNENTTNHPNDRNDMDET